MGPYSANVTNGASGSGRFSDAAQSIRGTTDRKQAIAMERVISGEKAFA
jgi:hypothetical protein